MCGITGAWMFKEAKVDKTRFERMTASLAHRGPDGQGIWLDATGEIALGHRRLSIIDLSDQGNQPMQYGDGRFVITFNGEIYNYIEIRAFLEKEGFTFRSQSDTEVLLALYQAKGTKCLDYLDGMFALAIWDTRDRTLFCARDRFGEKPFYYRLDGQRMVFASEMKALFEFGVPRAINDKMLYTYFAYKSLQHSGFPGETFYQGITLLEPATYMLVHADGSVRKEKYWEIDINEQRSINEAEAIEGFSELLNRSISRRLRSDVSVGSCLSGGLDSSAIVTLIDKMNEGRFEQNTFSARFENFEKDEGHHMQKVIDITNVCAHFTWPSAEKLVAQLDQLAYHQEEPIRTASAFAQWEVMKSAKENGVIVLMDGQGADEILAGYHPFYPVFFTELRKTNPSLYKKELKAYQALFGKPFTETWDLKLLRMAPKAYILARDVYLNKRPSWMHRDFHHRLTKTPNPHQRYFETLNEKLVYQQTKSGLNDLLRFADRNSMAFSREVRLPYLSHELVEFAMALPSNLKIRSGWTKYLLRKSMENKLPDSIAWRKDKIGFAPPHARWLKDKAIQERVRHAKQVLKDQGILDKRNFENADDWQALMASYLFEPAGP